MAWELGNPWTTQEFYTRVLLLLFVSLVFLVQLFLLFPSLTGRNQLAFDYYDKLAESRTNADEQKQEYIESYRHLREHGNAFLIIVLECLLGGTLFYAPMPWVIVLFLWVFPASVIWFFGNMLERQKMIDIKSE